MSCTAPVTSSTVSVTVPVSGAGGSGTLTSGAAVGALLIALAEQYGVAYAPTYGVVFQFAVLVLALAFRPQGILGSAWSAGAAKGGRK